MAPGGSRGTRRSGSQQQQQEQAAAEQRALAELRSLASDRGSAGGEDEEGPFLSGTASSKAGGRESEALAPQLFALENLQANMKAVNYGRSFLSIVAGVVAGILGLTGLAGFLFFLLVMLAASGAFLAKAGFRTSVYFDSPARIATENLMAGGLSFVLFWTLAYDIVHIF